MKAYQLAAWQALSPARVIAVDTSDAKLRLAREVGAEEAVMAGEGTAEAIDEATRGRGAELVIDMVGGDDTLAPAAQILRFESQSHGGPPGSHTGSSASSTPASLMASMAQPIES